MNNDFKKIIKDKNNRKILKFFDKFRNISYKTLLWIVLLINISILALNIISLVRIIIISNKSSYSVNALVTSSIISAISLLIFFLSILISILKLRKKRDKYKNALIEIEKLVIENNINSKDEDKLEHRIKKIEKDLLIKTQKKSLKKIIIDSLINE